MEDLKILDAVERYINGEMKPDERNYFEQLRKTNPEVDQLVVEHTFFLHQLNRFDETKRFKNTLNDVHIGLAEKGLIQSPKLQGKAKVVYLFNRYKRTAGIAASIAGITALAFSALMFSISPAKKANDDTKKLAREINALQKQNQRQNQEINIIKQNIPSNPFIIYKKGGTGFLISTKGLIVTNAHVIENAQNIAVQNNEGKDFVVKVVHVDAERDLAILKITDTGFKAPTSIPYTIKKSVPNIASPVYTLGFPRNDIVYGEGYLSAKTGNNGDTLTCQITIAANPGNSGGPIINRNGEIIGVLSAKQTTAEGVVFATQAKYIFNALNELQKDTAYKNIKLPATSSLKGLDREQQVEKITNYVYMVKVN